MKLDWKALLGLAITAFLLWFVMRDVNFADVWTHVREANWALLLAAVSVATFGFLIRALRWKVLLTPVRKDTSLRNRFAAVNVGFMANNLLPARVGEFARAYALSKVEPVSMSAALGSLVVERVLDAVALIGILAVTVTSSGFPRSTSFSEGPLGKALVAVVGLLVVLVVVLMILLAMPRRVVRLAERVAAKLPGDVARPVVDGLESFLGSLTLLRSPSLLVQGLVWSIGFWLWHGLSFWLGMLAFGIHAGPVAAYFTEAVVGFGVAIPASPGFFGTFHASASWALSDVFGVQRATSLAFAYGYHLGGFIPVTLIGLYYTQKLGLSLKDVGSSSKRVEEAVEHEMPVAERVLATHGAAPQAAARAAPSVSSRARRPAVSFEGRALLVDAPAKINLALHVGPARPDGFHDVETILQAVDLCDVLELRCEGVGVELSVAGADVGPIEQNLVTRAAQAYLDAAGLADQVGNGVRIRLEKRVPAGAGMGGGSSDAAATLRGLDRLFAGAVRPTSLLGIAANLGSDVPFFLSRTPLGLGRGRGELIEPLDPLPTLSGVIVVPPVTVRTAEAYAALDRARGEGPSEAAGARESSSSARRTRDWDEIARGAHNDFEPVVTDAHAEIRDALAALQTTSPLVALLSGSGSACFALYRSDREAQAAADALNRLRVGGRVIPIRTLAAWPEPADL